MILIDTHVFMWLFASDRTRLPQPVLDRIDSERPGLSPFVRLELAYLHQVGRIRYEPTLMVNDLVARIDLEVLDISAASVCRTAESVTWTRDPFDRLLASHAIVVQAPLLTRDRRLREHLSLAWWSDR